MLRLDICSDSERPDCGFGPRIRLSVQEQARTKPKWPIHLRTHRQHV